MILVYQALRRGRPWQQTKRAADCRPRQQLCCLQWLNVFSLQAFLAFNHVKLHLLAFGQAAEAVGLDGSVMDEYIFAALAGDEAKAFGVVKPLYCSLFHDVACFLDF
jgi:hypothetical protein